MKHLFTFTLLLALSLCIATSFAEEKKDAKPADNEASLDDLLKLPGTGDAKKPDKGKPLPPAADMPRTGDESVDAILKAIAEMEQAGQRLKVRQDAGIDTQRIQESVLKRLDQAIAIAQKQKQEQQQKNQQQKGNGQQKQENGSQENQQQKKPGEQGNKPGDKQPSNEGNKSEQVSPEKVEGTAGGPIEETRIEWGRLPARIRGELDQGLAEKFSPLYKKLTEAYYRRLAEEGKD